MRVLTHVACLVPFALLLWDGAHNRLTFNPIEEITTRTGDTTLRLLLLTLVCTPASTLLGFTWAVPLRRPLGLYAFFYASLHFLTFSVLDYGLDWGLIKQTIAEKPYVLVGFAAFLLIVPLAATSTKGWIRRLGKRWRLLHRLIYVSAALGVAHYYLLVKADMREPLLYAGILGVLLVLRLRRIRRPLARWRVRATRTRSLNSA